MILKQTIRISNTPPQTSQEPQQRKSVQVVQVKPKKGKKGRTLRVACRALKRRLRLFFIHGDDKVCLLLASLSRPRTSRTNTWQSPMKGTSQTSQPTQSRSRSGATVMMRSEERQCHVTGASEQSPHKNKKDKYTKQAKSKQGRDDLQGQRIEAIQWQRPQAILKNTRDSWMLRGTVVHSGARTNEYPGFNGNLNPMTDLT